MTVYLDLVVMLNFLVDFLLLLGTNRLCGFPAQPGRCSLGALLGALYGGVCLIPGFRFLGNLLWRSVCLTGMAVLSFGCNLSAGKRGGVFLLLSMALGGLSISIGQGSLPGLLLSAVGIWGLCCAGFSGGGREYVPITLHCGERSLTVIALRDTGNTLRDPITGEPVLVLSGQAARKLTGLTLSQLGSPVETLAQRPLPGLRLIPYRAVGQSGGILLGMRLSSVQIGNRKQSAVVAFAAEGLGNGEMYQALAGGVI